MRRLALILVLLAVPASMRAAESFTGIFDLWLGGIRAAKLGVAAEWDGTRFLARSRLGTTGLVEFFYEGSYKVTAEGRIENGRLVPARFEADSAFGEDRQKVEVLYEDGRPVRVTADPAFRPRPWEVDPAAWTGTFDPMTAALALLLPGPAAAACNRSVTVFDGRRVSRITLGAPVAPAAPGALDCPAVYERVAGFSPREMRKRSRWVFSARFRVGPDGAAEIHELTGDTGFGLAVVRRRG